MPKSVQLKRKNLQIIGFILIIAGLIPILLIFASIGLWNGIFNLIIGIPVLIIGVILVILGSILTKEIPDIKEEIRKISQSYTKINFRKLANIIGCNKKILLKTINEMVASKELEATIEFPFIIFENTKVSIEIPTDRSPTQDHKIESRKFGPPCPNCNRETIFISDYNRYFCEHCRKYV